MAIITDPDQLDRFQVLYDYVNQTIGIKPVSTNEPRVDLKTNGIVNSGTTYFDAAQDVNFSASGVVSGDILTIVEGENINHHIITGVPETGRLGTFTTFFVTQAATETNISFGVQKPTGGSITDGATLQALYSFSKEEWRTQESNFPDLIKHTFPLESITTEQFEIGGTTHGSWDWRDSDTRNLIRTGGWDQVNSTGLLEAVYAGIVTLGVLDSDTQVYYLQSANGNPVNFVLTGPVNQAIQVFDNAGADNRGFLKLFARKKGKSYVKSEIADIGVTTIRNFVNRFPLSHINDPAINVTDGDLMGTTPWQVVAAVNLTGTEGSVSTSTASAAEKTFTFTDSSAHFISDGLFSKDTLSMAGPNTGRYEIRSVDSETQLTLLQEPTVAITTDSSINYETFTRVKFSGFDNGEATNYLGDPNALTGLFQSVGALFDTNGVTTGDILSISTGNNSLVGVYKVLHRVSQTGIQVDTEDQAWPNAPSTNLTYRVFYPGMFLQFKQFAATGDPSIASADYGDVDFLNTDPDTIVRNVGSWIQDGIKHGMSLGVTNATSGNNNGAFIVDTVTTGTITLIASETLSPDLDETVPIFQGTGAFIRTLNAIDYPFSWRLFGRNGTLEETFEWVQKELRRTIDIDEGETFRRGDINDVLMTFASPNAVTLDMFIDDLNSADFNNVTKQDFTGDSRNFAFIAGITINLNNNILNAASSKITVFFTNDDAGSNLGNDFGTDNAIVVQDDESNPMTTSNPASSPLSFNFDYDNNAQRGAGSAGTDAPVTIVAIGTTAAQYVQVVGTIQRVASNIFSLTASLERNYENL